MPNRDELGVTFQRIGVQTKHGPRRVLVVTPVGEIRLGRERLAQMRAGDLESDLDDAIVHTCASEADGIHAVVFRATGDEATDTWRFADDLSDEEAADMARLFVCTHVALFRRLAGSGVVLVVGVDFAPRELAAYTRGTEVLATELERRLRGPDAAAAKQARLDLWLAERQAYWTATPYAEYVERKLADALVAAHRQLARFEKLQAEPA